MKDHLQLTKPCILSAKDKREKVCLPASTPSGWTTVAKARLVLCQFLDIDRASLTSDIHCCHACNNERCLNPLHLYFGTAFDNQQDVPADVKAQACNYDRGVRFIALDPKGFRYIADSFSRFTEMLPISSSTFHKYAETNSLQYDFTISLTLSNSAFTSSSLPTAPAGSGKFL